MIVEPFAGYQVVFHRSGIDKTHMRELDPEGCAGEVGEKGQKDYKDYCYSIVRFGFFPKGKNKFESQIKIDEVKRDKNTQIPCHRQRIGIGASNT